MSARGQEDPAFSVGFTDIDFSAPDASLFEFTPPTGATVTEQALPERTAAPDAAEVDHPRPAVIGEGWNAIVEVPSFAPGDRSTELGEASDAAAALDQFTTPVDGGRVVATSLVSILLTDDGRVFIGAVPADALRAAAE